MRQVFRTIVAAATLFGIAHAAQAQSLLKRLVDRTAQQAEEEVQSVVRDTIASGLRGGGGSEPSPDGAEEGSETGSDDPADRHARGAGRGFPLPTPRIPVGKRFGIGQSPRAYLLRPREPLVRNRELARNLLIGVACRRSRGLARRERSFQPNCPQPSAQEARPLTCRNAQMTLSE